MLWNQVFGRDLADFDLGAGFDQVEQLHHCGVG
jgi:hypothetical protein